MADCPKCGTHIKVYQMSPYCKHCGIHLMFASFEGQFQKDRRIAEMSMAFFRYNLTKFKSAYASGKAQIFRIIAAFFPVIALFLPLGSLTINTPVYSSSVSFNVLGLVYTPLFGNGLFMKLDALAATPVFGNIASSLKPMIIIYAVMAISAVFILLLMIFCFIGNKKVSILTSVFSVIGAVCAVILRISGSALTDACESAGSVAHSSINIFFIVAAVMFTVPLIAAVFCLKNPPVYNFREGDELRVEYRRKYKKGKIKLLDIPAPIYESEEDIKEKKKLISEAYNMDKEEVTADE